MYVGKVLIYIAGQQVRCEGASNHTQIHASLGGVMVMAMVMVMVMVMVVGFGVFRFIVCRR